MTGSEHGLGSGSNERGCYIHR